MAIVLKEKSGPKVPTGAHDAVCYRIVDLGTQPGIGEHGDKEKLLVFWELPHERIVVDGKEVPMGISKFYSKSLGEKSFLRRDLVAWRGRDFTKEELDGFELKNILGKGCQVLVIENKNGKHVVDAVFSLRKGTQVPPPWNPIVEYSIHDGKNEVYQKLPDWVKEYCNKCNEWTGAGVEKEKAPATEPPPPDEDSSVPF